MLKLNERSQFIGLGVRSVAAKLRRENRGVFRSLGSRSDALLFLTLVIQDEVFSEEQPDTPVGPDLGSFGAAPALGDGTLIATFERLLAFLIENQDAIKSLLDLFFGLIARAGEAQT